MWYGSKLCFTEMLVFITQLVFGFLSCCIALIEIKLTLFFFGTFEGVFVEKQVFNHITVHEMLHTLYYSFVVRCRVKFCDIIWHQPQGINNTTNMDKQLDFVDHLRTLMNYVVCEVKKIEEM